MVDVWLRLQIYEKKFDAELLFTDTCGLNYEIKSEDLYEEFSKDKHLFDFKNEMVVSKMKVVYKGIPINKFVGLKSKCILCSRMMVKNLIQKKE